MNKINRLTINNRNNNRIYLPLKLFVIYILATLFLNLFGPWQYQGMNKLIVSIFILFFLLTIIITYVVSSKLKTKLGISMSHQKKSIFFFDETRITKISLICSAVLFSLILFFRIVEEGFPNISNIFTSMATVYTNKETFSGKFNLSAWLFNYFSIFYIIGVSLGTYYFKILNIKYKVLYFLVISLSLLYHIGFIGNQKAIADLIIYIGSVLFIKFCQSGYKIKPKNIIFILFIILLMCGLFGNILYSRMDLWGVKYYSVGGKAFLNSEHWSLSLLNDKFKLGIGTLIFYLSSGYYGLSLTLGLPFKWSYGYGSSFALKDILIRLFPMSDHLIGSYPIRMEESTGWEAYSNWHTVFPWLASDFTFVGAIIVLNLIISIYVLAWKNILNKGNWTNILLFINVNILLVYLPANNQLFQTRSSLIITILTSILWIFNNNKKIGR